MKLQKIIQWSNIKVHLGSFIIVALFIESKRSLYYITVFKQYYTSTTIILFIKGLKYPEVFPIIDSLRPKARQREKGGKKI